MVESKKKTETVHSPLVTYASMISLLTLAPPFVNLLWYTMTAMDGSILKTFDYLNNNGLQGFVNLWPKPTLLSFQIIAVYAVFEATLQLLLPGETVYGPISPTGNRPVYKCERSCSSNLPVAFGA
ncbi:7-dehydrocholesterol reductase [Medicago truncatula]|uniref:7-dehydrocholesterol reductase n=1 Tax=Medicago truncatula TaxID=3880 RepID=A0A072URN5_MEDTR|nr:7-dehydrocholesterol reductase [Medicago truncatula]